MGTPHCAKLFNPMEKTTHAERREREGGREGGRERRRERGEGERGGREGGRE